MEDIVTPEEKNAISELEKRMEGERLPTEMYDTRTLLYKFLKARNFNVKKAEEMLRKTIRWRKEMQVQNVLRDHEPAEIIVKNVIQPHLGFDYDGYPVRYVAAGLFDLQGLFKSGNFLNVVRRAFAAVEEDILLQKSQSEKLGKPITKCVYIYDAAGMTISDVMLKCAYDYVLFVVNFLQDNYPEFLHRMYITNVPGFFVSVGWPILKNMLAPTIADKVLCYGKDGWKEELLKTMDPAILPVFLGGTRTDPDGNPRCVTLIGIGEKKVDEQFYKVKNINIIASKPDSKYIKLQKHEIEEITLQIRKPNSVIHWEFETKSHNIGFGLWYERSNGEPVEEIIPVHNVDTELEPEIAKYRCENCTGKYIIVFDNTHSWFTSKELYYRIWITDINGDQIKEE